jgi:hypothetical protein
MEVRTTLLQNRCGVNSSPLDSFREQTRERRHVHLGQLVGGAAGDLGDAEEGELGLELLELRLQLRLVLPPELVHLDPGCGTTTAASDPQKENPTKSKRVLVTAWLTHGDGGGGGEAEAAAGWKRCAKGRARRRRRRLINNRRGPWRQNPRLRHSGLNGPSWAQTESWAIAFDELHFSEQIFWFCRFIFPKKKQQPPIILYAKILHPSMTPTWTYLFTRTRIYKLLSLHEMYIVVTFTSD